MMYTAREGCDGPPDKEDPLQHQLYEALETLASIDDSTSYVAAVLQLKEMRKKVLQERVETFFQARFPELCKLMQGELHGILQTQLELDPMDEKVYKMQDLMGKILGLLTDCDTLNHPKLPF